MSHEFPIRVYYEDTDLAGIVYYANYLKFIERARTEWLRAAGIDQMAMKADGVVFAARRIEGDYLKPARFDDALIVRSSLDHMTAARIVLRQDVIRGDATLFTSRVTIVCMTEAGRPTRFPEAVNRVFA